MTLSKTIQKINDRIDALLLSGKPKDMEEFKRLARLHKNLVAELLHKDLYA